MVSTRSNGVRKVPPPAKKVVKAKPKKTSKKIVEEKQHEKNVEKVEIAKSEETKESPEEKKNEEDPAEKKQKVEEKKTTKKKSAEKVEPVAKNAASKDNDKKTVTIEACKQWGAFKTRAAKIQKGVGGRANVVINAVKPGKGNFVVRVGEHPIVELTAMARPFKKLKALDMDEVVASVLGNL